MSFIGTAGAGIEAVVIGASAGAFETLSRLVAMLPGHFPIPIIMVVHMGVRHDSKLLPLLQQQCKLALREAEDKVLIEKNTIYLAPPNYHVLVEKDKTLSLSDDPPEMHSRPSIDVLFESAADCYRRALVGVVLTGANSDGTKGLRTIITAGGIGIVEDPHEALYTEMPRSACTGNPTAKVMSVARIGNYLRRLGEA